MCGIAGVAFVPEGRSALQTVRAMTEAIVHRGPDESGYFCADHVSLGMRRLSIVDLMTGSQPITNEDGTIQIVFNGMIYNFRELRSRLQSLGHVFATTTDTEVIVHAYEQYGDACVAHLNGMFAFAIWDGNRERLLIARDRLGKKPLHYTELPKGGIAFCSEIKGLLRHHGVSTDVDFGAIDEYLAYSYIAEPRSAFRAIKKLPAGHTLAVSSEGVKLTQYWSLPVEAYGDMRNDAQVEDRLGELLTDAIRIRLEADVPVGVLLSGGLDSGTILALGSCVEHGVRDSFSMGAGPGSFDELPIARLVASRYGMRHHETTLDAGTLASLPAVLGALDEPFGDPSAVPTYHLSRFVRQTVKVALSGDGGDELFAGYGRYRRDYLIGMLERAPRFVQAAAFMAARTVAALPGSQGPRVRRLIQEANNDVSRVVLLFDDTRRKALYTPDAGTDRVQTVSASSPWPHADRLTRRLAADFTTYLRDDLLVKMDRMSMACSLEVRSPLLDHRIVEFMFSVAPSLKMRGHKQKYLLRRLMRDRLPRETLHQQKRGFEIPVHALIRGPWREFVSDILLGNLKRRGLMSPSVLEALVQRHMSGVEQNGHLLWALVVLECWFGNYVDRARAV